MSLNWKPFIADGHRHRRALMGLFQAGIQSKLEPRALSQIAADIAQISAHDTDEVQDLAQSLLDYAPKSASAHYFAAQSLRLAERDQDSIAACEHTLTLDPTHAEATVLMGKLLVQTGQHDRAETLLRKAVEIAPKQAVIALCECLIRQGKFNQAARVISEFDDRIGRPTGLVALDCVCSLIRDDRDRQQELQDDTLISARILQSNGDSTEFASLCARLAASIKGNRALVEEPASTTTTNGKQAFLHDLLDQSLLSEVITLIREGVETYVHANGDHPYLRNLPDELRLTSWAVNLRHGGFQKAHIHPGGTLSGVFYVDVDKPSSRTGDDGAIEFWRPPEELIGGLEADTKLVLPQNGMMLIFPSYFYHRTVPHEGEGGRISIAFDVA